MTRGTPPSLGWVYWGVNQHVWYVVAPSYRRSGGRRPYPPLVTGLIVIPARPLGMVRAVAVEVPEAVRERADRRDRHHRLRFDGLSLGWRVRTALRPATPSLWVSRRRSRLRTASGSRSRDAAGEVVAWGQVHGSRRGLHAHAIRRVARRRLWYRMAGAAVEPESWSVRGRRRVVFTVGDKTYRDEVVIALRTGHRAAGKLHDLGRQAAGATRYRRPPSVGHPVDGLLAGHGRLHGRAPGHCRPLARRSSATPFAPRSTTVDATNGSVYERPLPRAGCGRVVARPPTRRHPSSSPLTWSTAASSSSAGAR